MHTLPREITFNPVARVLQQAPVEELRLLRGNAASNRTGVRINADRLTDLGIPGNTTRQSEVVVSFELPQTAATFGVKVGSLHGGSGHGGWPATTHMPDTDLMEMQDTRCKTGKTSPEQCAQACQERSRKDKHLQFGICVGWVIYAESNGDMRCCTGAGVPPCPVPASTSMQCGFQNTSCTAGVPENTSLVYCGEGDSVVACSVQYPGPPTDADAAYTEVAVSCGPKTDVLRLVATETTVEIRVFMDHALIEGYFQQGRVAMTLPFAAPLDATVALEATADVTALSAAVYPIRDIWVTPADVRAAPRVFPAAQRG